MASSDAAGAGSGAGSRRPVERAEARGGMVESWSGVVAELQGEEALQAFFASRATLAGPALVEELAHEALRYARIDLIRAETLAVAAGRLAAALDNAASRGFGHRALAHVHYLSARFGEAADLYAAALEEFRLGGDEREAAKTQSNALQALILLGRYDEAERWAGEAREAFVRHGERMLLARLECNFANLLHRQDLHEEALAKYEAALEVFRSDGGDPQAMVAALLNSFVCLIILGDFKKALDRYQEVAEHCRRHDMPLPAMQADYNLAYLYYHRGEYTRALELYRHAADRSRELGDRYHEALCHLDLAEVYLEVNLTEEGSELAGRAQEAFERLGMRYEASKALTFLAIAASQQHQLMRAVALFRQARGGFGDEGNAAWCALVDVYQALVLLEAGQPPAAWTLAERARLSFVELNQHRRIALCELLLARIAVRLGTLEPAREHSGAALERLERLDHPQLLYQALFVAGQVAEAMSERPEALERYQAACELLENLRSHLHAEDLKIAFLKDKQEVYQSLIWTSLGAERLDLDQREEIFRWVERAKSRTLADMIAPRAPALPPPGDLSGLARRMNWLREELNWYYRRLDDADLQASRRDQAPGLLGSALSPRRAQELRRRSRQFEDRLLRIMSLIRSRELDFGSLQAGGSVELEAIRESLPEDTVLLEYYEARGRVLGFVLGRETLDVRVLTTSETVRRIQGFLQFQLSKFQLGEDYVQAFARPLEDATRAHLAELYHELVAPLRALLRGRSLIVVPHGSLHYVPFHALWDGDAYLVDRFAVSYAPSASVFQLCSARPQRPSSGALVLGVPDPLNPGILEEARAVSSALPGARVVLGPAVNEAVLREHGSRSRIVHIAAHGMFRRDSPMFSAIQLGVSRLTLFDLYELELACEVVVLSGCGTGLSVVEDGDELIGLVRGLLYAGAQTVVATLWDAQDESTARFMEAFYRRLQGTPERAAALRQAMIELRETHPHPFHWAPFFLAGRPSGPSAS